MEPAIKQTRTADFTRKTVEDDISMKEEFKNNMPQMEFNQKLSVVEKSTVVEEEDGNFESQRKSTLQKFSKEVFISNVEIIDFKELAGGHISYVIRARGRTKYLVNVPDLAQIGLISKT